MKVLNYEILRNNNTGRSGDEVRYDLFVSFIVNITDLETSEILFSQRFNEFASN